MMLNLTKLSLLLLVLFLGNYKLKQLYDDHFPPPRHLTGKKRINARPLDFYFAPPQPGSSAASRSQQRRVLPAAVAWKQQQESGRPISTAASTSLSLFGIDRVDHSRRLEFVHITKTGGSAIEMGGAAAGVQWGACHYLQQEHLGCTLPANWEWPIELDMPDHMKHKTHNEPWHSPPHWLVPNPQPKDNVVNFLVVRNPYQRVLSEFYCSSFGYNGTVSATSLNAWIVGKLTEDSDYFGHLLPQHYYVFHHDSGDRLVDHVLRFETLTEDFNFLMELYQLDIRMPERTTANHFVIDEASPRLTEADLSVRTVQLINQYYQLDFDLFDYERIKI